MTTMIAMETLLAGSTEFLPGDRLDIDELRKSAGWFDRLIDQLTRSKRIAELGPETFRIAAARRVQGTPWPPRGFTQAFLEEGGYIEASEAPKPPGKKKAEKGKPPGREVVRVDRVKLTEDAIQVGKNFIQPKKNGRFTLYDATDADGRLLRDKSFRSIDAAKAFLEALSTTSPAPDTSGAKQEAGNGGDLQPSADGSEGQGSTEDR